MTDPLPRDSMFLKRQFDAQIIVLCVRWYVTYKLSYRDLVAMMAERGVHVSHTTIMRWVQRYVPEFQKRWSRFACPVGRSWRVDETYILVKGRWCYLYRAVDKRGRTVDFQLSESRGIEAAKAFFRQALTTHPARPRGRSRWTGMFRATEQSGCCDVSIRHGVGSNCAAAAT